jgi:hypothetical protein
MLNGLKNKQTNKTKQNKTKTEKKRKMRKITEKFGEMK